MHREKKINHTTRQHEQKVLPEWKCMERVREKKRCSSLHGAIWVRLGIKFETETETYNITSSLRNLLFDWMHVYISLIRKCIWLSWNFGMIELNSRNEEKERGSLGRAGWKGNKNVGFHCIFSNKMTEYDPVAYLRWINVRQNLKHTIRKPFDQNSMKKKIQFSMLVHSSVKQCHILKSSNATDDAKQGLCEENRLGITNTDWHTHTHSVFHFHAYNCVGFCECQLYDRCALKIIKDSSCMRNYFQINA